MFALPSLTHEGARVRLPLSTAGARELEVALLSDRSAARRTALAALLHDEPALLLWCVCKAERDGLVPTSRAAAAEWLEPRLADLLTATEIESHQADPRQGDAWRDRRETFAELTAASWRAARRESAGGGDAPAEQAELAGLLQNADAWLAAAAPEITVAARKGLLPERLRNSSAEPAADEEATDTLRRRSAERWQPADPLLAARLPLLAARVMRLEALEARFAETLEREKLESLRQLAYGAGHEINNPLANISAGAQTLLRDEQDPERRRRLAAINSQAFRAHEMIADLMLFSRPPELQPEAIDLIELVDGVLAELQSEAKPRGTRLLRIDGPGPVLVRADRVQLGVALRAMCANSLEALGMGGEVAVDVRRAEDGGGERAEIEVRDDGPGITPQQRPHLFDPFYSGREAGRGLGFGLSKCWRIVTDHGGTIDVESREGEGARFRIVLPKQAMNDE